MTRLIISLVTPCFNEHENVEACYREVKRVLEATLQPGESYEHIFSDNGSTDGTREILLELAKSDERVKLIFNTRNFGPFNSMFNGLLSSSGESAIPLVAADLQDPVDLIPQMIQYWKSGYQIVYGARRARREFFLMKWARKLYYRAVNALAEIEIPVDVGEFTLIDRAVVDSLSKSEDYYPYVRGLIANTGFKSTTLNYTWAKRERGKSKNNMYKLFDQGINGLISFTNVPMRILLFFGFAISLISLTYAIVQFFSTLLAGTGDADPGIQTLIVGTFFLSGCILFALGMLGEYVAAIHSQVRRRPLVIEESRVNF